MKWLIDLIFRQHNYAETWKNEEISFYKNTDLHQSSYFLINYIDCEKVDTDEKIIKKKLSELERNYVKRGENEKSLKAILQSSALESEEISQLDKNLSAIYVIRFSDLNNVEQCRNIIYSIEESPNYFKRYVIPYTETQVCELRKVVEIYNEKNIANVLTKLADNEEEYYALLERKKVNSLYELIIRLFSKIPFLQYIFEPEPISISIETTMKEKISAKLFKYHNLLESLDIDLEQLISMENYDSRFEEECECKVMEILEVKNSAI